MNRTDKPFSCNICGGKFSRYSSLWSHKKLHSGEKNYKCELCSASFAKAVYLKNHMRIHSGEVRTNIIDLSLLEKFNFLPFFHRNLIVVIFVE
jgi:uncharacterized Zn-finger protein